jgi:uncharacterized repeat protein (TIGR01451 family)/CSLREA domain-containing protein
LFRALTVTRSLLGVVALLAVLLPPASPVRAATFTVTTNADSGPGSLRAAIIAAHTSPGADTITFSIGSGVQTIDLLSPLPGIVGTVTIDGTTQPGFSGTPLIELRSTTNSFHGLALAGDNSLIRGLSVTGFSSGILLAGNAISVQGNYLGLRADGVTAGANEDGISVVPIAPFAATGNRIGGTNAAERNVISGNARLATGGAGFARRGIGIYGAPSTRIEGNFIGLNAAGTAAVPNDNGISVHDASGTIIGGTTAAARNVISGNDNFNIYLANSDGNTVQGNRIGLNAAGTASISANARAPGVQIDNGVYVSGGLGTRGRNNTIGGTAAGAGNEFGVTSPFQIRLDERNVPPGTVRDNVFLGNSITRAGIDLNGQALGVSSFNDALDADEGPNHVQNAPVITSVAGTGPGTVIQGTLHTTPNTSNIRVEVFSSPTCNIASPNGSTARTFLSAANVNTDGAGNASFNVVGNVPAGEFASALATSGNNTSPISNCKGNLTGGANIQVTTLADENGMNPLACSLREAVTAANTNAPFGGCIAGTGIDEITFAVNGNFLLTGSQITLTTEGLTITGNGPANTVIDPNDTSRAFVVNERPATFRNLSIQNGNATGDGGAIQIIHTGAFGMPTVVIDNVELHDNQASVDGGAIGGTIVGQLTLLNSTLIRNTAGQDGGAISLRNPSAAGFSVFQIDSSTISNNGAARDGGGVNLGAFVVTSVFSRIMVNGNTAGRDGGGSYLNTQVDTFLQSTFDGNTAGRDGGGVRSRALVPALSTFSDNQAGGDGGGFWTGQGLGAFTTTISGNRALAGRGGGAFINGVTSGASPSEFSTITNNRATTGGGLFINAGGGNPLTGFLLADNPQGGNCAGATMDSRGFNFSSDNTCAGSFTQGSDGNNAALPLGSLANNGGPTKTHMPQSGNAAIDVMPVTGACQVDATFGGSPAHDQRGVARPVGLRCDAGAVERDDVPLPPAVSIAKGADPTPAQTGQPLTYTLTATNTSSLSPATGVTVTDTLPANVTFVSATPSQGSCSGTATVTCNLGNLPALGTATITIVVIPQASTAGTTLTNQASVVISGTNLSAQTGATVQTPVQAGPAVADLGITKAGPASVAPGGTLVYTLTVTNAGAAAAAGVSVADPTPAGLTFISNSGDCLTAFPCALGSVGPGVTRTITSTYQVPAGYSGANPIVNTATVSTTSQDATTANDTAGASTAVTAPPPPGTADVSIVKAGPASVAPGSPIVYTVTVTNSGPVDATGVIVSDLTPNGLSFVSNSGACLTPYPCAIGTIPAGQSRVITTTMNVPAGYAGANPIVNIATVNATTTDANAGNNSSTASTPLLNAPPAPPPPPPTVPIATVEPVPTPEKDPEPRKLTKEQRQQVKRTDASSLDDTHIEGNVLAVDPTSTPPTMTIGSRDGTVTLRLHEDAAELARFARVGQYFVGSGEKEHEQLWDIYEGDVE